MVILPCRYFGYDTPDRPLVSAASVKMKVTTRTSYVVILYLHERCFVCIIISLVDSLQRKMAVLPKIPRSNSTGAKLCSSTREFSSAEQIVRQNQIATARNELAVHIDQIITDTPKIWLKMICDSHKVLVVERSERECHCDAAETVYANNSNSSAGTALSHSCCCYRLISGTRHAGIAISITGLFSTSVKYKSWACGGIK